MWQTQNGLAAKAVRASMGLMSRAQRGSPATKGLEKRPGPVLQKRAHSVGQCEPYTLGILIHEHRANAGVHRASGVAAQEAVLEFTHREVATDTHNQRRQYVEARLYSICRP